MGLKDIAIHGHENWQQLAMLRAVTERTGALHEAQVLNLKLWPLVLFQTATKSTFKIDLPRKTIAFTVNLSSKVKADGARIKPAAAPGALDEWVKALLGEDWDVTIYLKGAKPKTFHFAAQTKEKESVEDLCNRLTAQDATKRNR